MNDIFEKITSSLENVNYDEYRDKSFRRYCYTWNHPFFDSELFEEVDIDNTDLPLDFAHYDLHNLTTDYNKEFFDFRYIKYEDYKAKDLKVIIRPFFKDSNSIRQYLTGFSTFKYSCFQIEKGGNCETIHIQGFITFKSPMTWSTFKNYFPCAHFNKCISSNTSCKDYCSKIDTRVDGPFEDGEFSEERSRTDIKQFLELVNLGTDDDELQSLYPSLYLKEFTKIDKLRDIAMFKEFKTNRRKVEVTYIYGPPRCGKTTYISSLYGYDGFYSVTTYDRGPFDNYHGEKVIVFDEYESQIKISQMNQLIDSHPVQLPCRFNNKWACYDKVYIISNSPLSEQYSSDFIKPIQRDAFMSRIHKVIRFDSKGNMYIEKDINNPIDDQIELIPLDDESILDIFN